MRKEWLEDTVTQITAEYILDPAQQQRIIQKCLEVQERDLACGISDEIAALQKAQAEARRKQSNIVAIIEDGAGVPALTVRLNELTAEITRLQYQLDALTTPQPKVTKDQLHFMLDQFRCQPGEQDTDYKRRLLDTFVSEVILSTDKLIVKYNLTNKKGEAEASLLDLSSLVDGSTMAQYGGDNFTKFEPCTIVCSISTILLIFPLNSRKC